MTTLLSSERIEKGAITSRETFNKLVIPLAIRWVLDKEVEIALWGARRPEQLAAVDGVLGWTLDDRVKDAIEKSIQEAVKDPVGPEFMAPPRA